jgi:hypothetical protein
LLLSGSGPCFAAGDTLWEDAVLLAGRKASPGRTDYPNSSWPVAKKWGDLMDQFIHLFIEEALSYD